MSATARRFHFEILLIDGSLLHSVRVCDRKIPPNPQWVLQDQRDIYCSHQWALINTVEKGLVTVNRDHIISMCIIKTEQGLNTDDIKERYGIGKDEF